MENNIKASKIRPKLTSYISIIPTFQIGRNQVQNVSMSSQAHVDKSQNINDDIKLNYNQQSKQYYNNFSSKGIESVNEIKENKNATIESISNISPLILNPPNIMPQNIKLQIPLINRVNSNESLNNSPSISNRSNIDIILNNTPEIERSFGDNRFNSNINSGNINKIESIIT